MKILHVFLFLLIINACTFAQADTDSVDSSSSSHTAFITSDPSNASVFINDSLYGKTPLKIYGFDKTTFVVEMLDESGNKWKMGVQKHEDSEFNLHALIGKDYSLLEVISEPSGADVYINDSLYGKTPINGIHIPSGSVKLRLQKENYVCHEEFINTPSYSPHVYTKYIHMKSVYSYVEMKTISDLSNISIDNKPFSGLDDKPVKLINGEHNIEVTGYEGKHSLDMDFTANSDTLYSLFIRHNQFDSRPLLYSLILPGIGQAYDGSTLEGTGIFTLFVASAISTYLTSDNYTNKENEYNERREKYLASTNEMEAQINKELMMSAKDNLDKAELPKQISTGLLIGTYVYNIIDVLLFHSRKDFLAIRKVGKYVNLSGNAVNNNVSLNLKLGF